MKHFIYPLNANNRKNYGFLRSDDEMVATSYGGFREAELGDESSWLLATGFRKLEVGDLLWAYFAKPDGFIGAVGYVRDVLPPAGEEERRIRIAWDQDLCKQLESLPIKYEQYRQNVQAAVNEANPKTTRVLERWLASHQDEGDRERHRAARKTRRELDVRLGQADFRYRLREAYESSCAVTSCTIPELLQAAHILAVKDGGGHDVTNGLLLRADIHNLFDAGLMNIASGYVVEVDSSVEDADYQKLHGRKLNLPARQKDYPSRSALKRRRSVMKNQSR